MKCRKCNGTMKSGIAFVPIFGYIRNGKVFTENISRGQTVYAVSAKLVQCMKCVQCGHSTT